MYVVLELVRSLRGLKIFWHTAMQVEKLVTSCAGSSVMMADPESCRFGWGFSFKFPEATGC